MWCRQVRSTFSLSYSVIPRATCESNAHVLYYKLTSDLQAFPQICNVSNTNCFVGEIEGNLSMWLWDRKSRKIVSSDIIFKRRNKKNCKKQVRSKWGFKSKWKCIFVRILVSSWPGSGKLEWGNSNCCSQFCNGLSPVGNRLGYSIQSVSKSVGKLFFHSVQKAGSSCQWVINFPHVSRPDLLPLTPPLLYFGSQCQIQLHSRLDFI